ncbi:MAG: ABC transporter permease subunit [Spirochaetaceae bacterium]|jgi:L-cystine transport system permease protein|nr:ABC transporter permease subunit [Spirochaetaceae bacterium]
MNFDFLFMLQAMAAAAGAIPRSLAIAFSAVFLGILLGSGLALVRFYKVPFAGRAAQWFITIIKGIPTILVYFILFTLLTQSTRIKTPIELITLLGITVGTSAEISEMIRGGLESVEKSQFDAALSIGHTGRHTLFRIILPQIVPVCVPVMSGVVIHAIKALPVAVMIGLHDILNTAIAEAVINYRYLESYVAAALIFWAIFIAVEKGFSIIEKRYKQVKV